jgi:hypothetical protein
MVLPGYDYEAGSQAKSKKDAQTAAAWLFANYLVKAGKITQDKLPSKNVEKVSEIASDCPGGWTIDSARIG